jgi:type II secretory pathway component PulJ
MSRAGAALLEVIIAMTLLTIGGLGVAEGIVRATHHLERSRRQEAEMREASRFMQAVALWPRADLDRRLGRRQQGPWYLRVDRLSAYLYELELTSADSMTVVRTAVFRPR